MTGIIATCNTNHPPTPTATITSCGHIVAMLNREGMNLIKRMPDSISQLNRAMMAYMAHLLCNAVPMPMGLYQLIKGKHAMNNPAAGMGIPLKKFCCDACDTLYLASLTAPAATNMNAGIIAVMSTSSA